MFTLQALDKIGGGIFVVSNGAVQFAKNISGDSNRVPIGWEGGGPSHYWAAASTQQLNQLDFYQGLVGNVVIAVKWCVVVLIVLNKKDMH